MGIETLLVYLQNGKIQDNIDILCVNNVAVLLLIS